MSIFTAVKGLRFRRNHFDLSHDNQLSMPLGKIVPVCVIPNTVPNSTFWIKTMNLSRFQALLAPMQHRTDMYIHWWKMPIRLMDKNFTAFLSGEHELEEDWQYNPAYFTYEDVLLYLRTKFENNNLTPHEVFYSGSLLDYLGYACMDTYSVDDLGTKNYVQSLTIGAEETRTKLTIRPLQMYCTLLNLWYTNENFKLSDELTSLIKSFSSDSLEGNQSQNVAELLYELSWVGHSRGLLVRFGPNRHMCFPHAWSKDYFTSALPFVQVGEPVKISFGGTAPVSGSVDLSGVPVEAYTQFQGSGTVGTPSNKTESTPIEQDGDEYFNESYDPSGNPILQRVEDGTSVDFEGTADLSEADAISIEDFRIANALQSLKEAKARYGRRWREYIKGFFNQKLSDQSLQQPQWLKGGKVNINISEIEQTSATTDSTLTGANTPQGNLAGKGIGAGANFCNFKCHTEEPCYIMAVAFIQPRGVYGNQGMPRQYMKLDNEFDFFNPKAEHLGEQALKLGEIFYGRRSLMNGYDPNTTFGYTARYAEYKFMKSEVHGQMMNWLSFWHMARIFTAKPTLSPSFLYLKNEDTNRPFAVQSVQDGETPVDIDPVISWFHFSIDMKAPMSKFGTPRLMN